MASQRCSQLGCSQSTVIIIVRNDNDVSFSCAQCAPPTQSFESQGRDPALLQEGVDFVGPQT